MVNCSGFMLDLVCNVYYPYGLANLCTLALVLRSSLNMFWSAFIDDPGLHKWVFVWLAFGFQVVHAPPGFRDQIMDSSLLYPLRSRI